MTPSQCLRGSARWLPLLAAFGAGAYATHTAMTWTRFGRPVRPSGAETDELLDRFIPTYDVVERHHIEVDAPAALTLETARRLDLSGSPIIRAIFKGRELIMGAEAGPRREPRGMLEDLLSFGWVVLAEVPGREIVLGAVTKPWEANPVFRSVPPEEFARFDEPAYVKIAFTLRADPTGPSTSVFRTETRALATDTFARERFRLYWSFLSPGIWLIRQMMLRPVRREAARRANAA